MAPGLAQPFLVVGIGASAGGIGVLKEFFRHVPATTGNAYVVILHLSPEHESLLSEILQTVAAIPVAQVTERVRLEPDHAYVIAPNKSLAVVDGHLHVSDVIGFEARRAPVDIFFRTLAEAKDAHAVCVVLSGTGPNGSMGLKRVKERGGIAIAQDPGEAEFSDMPRNAVATGLVDYVLPVREIPTKIQTYQARLQQIPPPGPSDEHPTDEQLVREILAAVRAQTGHDFVQYKRGTLLRRMHRRMSVHELPDLLAYRQFLGAHPDEAVALLRDLLISVTNFFRDPEAWATLESIVIPRLLEERRPDDVIRVWVAGCATGEEAYSMAMALSDAVATLTVPPRFQVFATDIDAEAIAVARAGLYTNSDVADVPPERLRRFFVREGDEYRVRREVRDGLLFTVHNILRDPPFSAVDLVSCRNLLIYLNRTAQERVMQLLHFSLRPGGYLFLGSSELLTSFGDLFSVVDKDHRIAQSRAVPRRFAVFPRDLSGMTSLPSVPVLARDEAAVPSHRPPHPLDIHQRLLEAYGPPSIVINEDHDILHMSENAGKYLHFPSGEASTNLLTLIRPELRVELRAAVYQALQQRTNVEASGLPLSGDGARVNLRVRPALANEPGHGLLLVLFEEADQADGHTPAGEAIRPVGPAVRQMEEELTNVRAKLRAATQQYESQYDEFKAANEELQAMNEELRSAGEELETSKEELQSVNEELTTVNQELKVKVEELGHANDDFRNLMNSTDIATIFLDRALRVKQFTPKATEIFSLLPSDLGRPLLDLKHRLKHDGLLGDMEDVLTRLQIVEREVEAQDGTWFAVRVFPYRTSDDRLDGVVLTFVDITLRRDMIRSLQAAQEQLRLAQQASQSALWERDLVTGAERWSPEMYQIRAVDPPESPDLSVDHAAGIHHDDRARVKSALDDTVRQHRVEWDIEFRVANGEQKENSAAIRWIAERGRVRYDNGDAVRVLGVDFDVTHRKAADAAQARLASIVALSRDAVVSFDFERRVVTWNHGAETIFGLTAAEALGRDLSSIVLPEAGRQDDTIFQDVEAGRPVQDFVTRARTKSGGEIDVSVSASPVVDQAGDVIGGSLIVRDVSMQAEAERGMRQHAADLEQRVAERTQQLIDTQEEERRRIARDLHDHLGQQLTALRLSLAVCKEHAAGDTPQAAHAGRIGSNPAGRRRGVPCLGAATLSA